MEMTKMLVPTMPSMARLHDNNDAYTINRQLADGRGDTFCNELLYQLELMTLYPELCRFFIEPGDINEEERTKKKKEELLRKERLYNAVQNLHSFALQSSKTSYEQSPFANKEVIKDSTTTVNGEKNIRNYVPEQKLQTKLKPKSKSELESESQPKSVQPKLKEVITKGRECKREDYNELIDQWEQEWKQLCTCNGLERESGCICDPLPIKEYEPEYEMLTTSELVSVVNSSDSENDSLTKCQMDFRNSSSYVDRRAKRLKRKKYFEPYGLHNIRRMVPTSNTYGSTNQNKTYASSQRNVQNRSLLKSQQNVNNMHSNVDPKGNYNHASTYLTISHQAPSDNQEKNVTSNNPQQVVTVTIHDQDQQPSTSSHSHTHDQNQNNQEIIVTSNNPRQLTADEEEERMRELLENPEVQNELLRVIEETFASLLDSNRPNEEPDESMDTVDSSSSNENEENQRQNDIQRNAQSDHSYHLNEPQIDIDSSDESSDEIDVESTFVSRRSASARSIISRNNGPARRIVNADAIVRRPRGRPPGSNSTRRRRNTAANQRENQPSTSRGTGVYLREDQPSTSRGTGMIYQRQDQPSTSRGIRASNTSNRRTNRRQNSAQQNQDESDSDNERRRMHNNMERERRINQKVLLNALKNSLPSLQNSQRVSKVAILTNAIRFIREQNEYEQLRNRNIQLRQQLARLEHMTVMATRQQYNN